MNDTTGDIDDRRQFAIALDDLKQTGCLVLVTGTVDETVRAACSRRLFGSSSRPRQRIIVHPDCLALGIDAYLPSGVTETSSGVRSLTSSQMRGGTATSSGTTQPADRTSSPDAPSDHIDTHRFDTLLEEIESTAKTLAPGELRVGILTGSELLDQYGQSATQSLLLRVREQIRIRQGMAHCHLPLPTDHPVVSALVTAADVHIRLREREGYRPEQYWSLREVECDSGWLSLDTDS